MKPINILVPESEGLYANRITPELDGDLVGFDLLKGGPRRMVISTRFKHINKVFETDNWIIVCRRSVITVGLIHTLI